MHKFLCIPIDDAHAFVQCVRVSKKAKLREKLMAGDKDRTFTFQEVEQLLTNEGFIVDGGKGSHCVYRHSDGRKMILPKHGKDVKPAYIKQIRQLLT